MLQPLPAPFFHTPPPCLRTRSPCPRPGVRSKQASTPSQHHGLRSSHRWTRIYNAFISYVDELANGTTINYDALVQDDVYEIKTVGDINWTSIGATLGTQGERFTRNGVAETGATGDAYAVNTSSKFTVVYDSDRSLFIRVRDGGTDGDNVSIKTFETTGTLASGGGSTTTIRNSDA